MAFKFSDVCFVNRNYVDDYADEDVFMGVHLGREVGFDWHLGDAGVCLRKKDAAENAVKKADNFLDDIQRTTSPSFIAGFRAFEEHMLARGSELDGNEYVRVVSRYARLCDVAASHDVYSEARRDILGLGSDCCDQLRFEFDDEDSEGEDA